jgi:hypothetical protein
MKPPLFYFLDKTSVIQVYVLINILQAPFYPSIWSFP